MVETTIWGTRWATTRDFCRIMGYFGGMEGTFERVVEV